MSNKEDAIERIKLLKKQAEQIISDKTKLEQVKPKILPHLVNKLDQLIGNIEEIETIDHRLMVQATEDRYQLETQVNSYGKRYQVLEELRNNVFCNKFFTQENIDNVSYIRRHLENIATISPLIIPTL